MAHWHGDYAFTLRTLVLKEFRIRYRNMSLGVLWSMVNPLVMMTVLTFVFTHVFKTEVKDFPVFVLCGLIPFNFFSLAWATGTNSLLDNAGLIKRVPVPREIVPIASVLGNSIHLLIQFCLLVGFVLASGYGVNRHWLWLPLIWLLDIAFVLGLVLMCSALAVYVRDTRYVVESINTVLIWFVPVFYSFKDVPAAYAPIYQLNPVAALVMAMRNILMDGVAPPSTLLLKLALGSMAALVFGWAVFSRLKRHFYNYL